MITLEEKKAYLKEMIQTDVIISGKEAEIPILYKTGKELAWFCDFRRAFSDKTFLTYAADLVWDTFDKNASYQIGGLESAALPFITATVLQSENATGFFIRKSRKKKGQTRLIEGKMTDQPVILVDDLIGRGGTFEKQVKTLEEAGYTVAAVFAIVRFKPVEEYAYLMKKNIPIHSVFTLDEFDIPRPKKEGQENSYKIDWYFGPKDPHKLVQGARALPALDDTHLYTGSDNGTFWKLRLKDGVVEKKTALERHTDLSKSTFTNVIAGTSHVLVGSWTGAVHTLRKEDLGLVSSVSVTDTFTSPLTNVKNTVLVATKSAQRSCLHTMLCFDIERQRVRWEVPVQGEVCNITVDPTEECCVVGTATGRVYKIELRAGTIVWEKKYQASFMSGGVFRNAMAETIVFVSYEGRLYTINTETGACEHETPFERFVSGTPIIDGDRLYATSLEREAYCYDLKNNSYLWTRTLDGRSTTPPLLLHQTLYVGDNSGTLHALNAETGALRGSHLITERINNGVIQKNGTLFVTTAVNEVYRFSEHPYSE